MSRLVLFAALLAAAGGARERGVAARDSLPSIPTAEEVARRVDEHFYYPQEHGLERLSADVRVPALDTLFAASGTAVPRIEFVWRSPDTRSFIVGPSEAQELRAQVVRLLDGRGELIIPRPLAQTLARYESRSIEARGDTIVLAASTADTTVDLRSLRLLVETDQWRVLRMEARTARGTLVSENEFRQADDLNVLSRMNVRYGDIEARIGLEYVPYEGFWLASKISYAIRGGTVGLETSRFVILLDSFRANAAPRDSAGGG